MKKITNQIYNEFKEQPILHDEDEWNGKYKTYGDMWKGEGYAVEKRTGLNKTEFMFL